MAMATAAGATEVAAADLVSSDELVRVLVYEAKLGYTVSFPARGGSKRASRAKRFAMPAFELTVAVYGFELGYGFAGAGEDGIPCLWRRALGRATSGDAMARRALGPLVASLEIGRVTRTRSVTRRLIATMGAARWRPEHYNVVDNNSVHFASALAAALVVGAAPDALGANVRAGDAGSAQARAFAVTVAAAPALARLGEFGSWRPCPPPGSPTAARLPNGVWLHVYDISDSVAVLAINSAALRAGRVGGAFHAAVEVFGLEWSFGFAPSGTGVFRCAPRGNTGHVYRTTVFLGVTELSRTRAHARIAAMRDEWPGASYELLTRNCCHFCVALVDALGGQLARVPEWVTRGPAAGARVRGAGRRLAASAADGVGSAVAAAGPLRARIVRVGARLRRILTRGEQAPGLAVTRPSSTATAADERAADETAARAPERVPAIRDAVAGATSLAGALARTRCLLCWERPASVRFAQCGHVTMCLACLDAHTPRSNAACPLCGESGRITPFALQPVDRSGSERVSF